MPTDHSRPNHHCQHSFGHDLRAHVCRFDQAKGATVVAYCKDLYKLDKARAQTLACADACMYDYMRARTFAVTYELARTLAFLTPPFVALVCLRFTVPFHNPLRARRPTGEMSSI